MGRFVNSDNSAFQAALNSEIYVDKSGMIAYTNKILNSNQAFVCNSRPRRFGKSMAANMLAAYYSRGADSAQMFEGLEISREPSFREHLNRYDVIHFDVQWFMQSDDVNNIVKEMQAALVQEMREEYPTIVDDQVTSISMAMSLVNAATGNKFVVIIDEWDVLIRDESNNQRVQEEYINLLRTMFKGIEPTKYIALAYLTGILPIKKERTQSALNNFDEYTILDAGQLAPYVGFTEDEVRQLCERYHQDYDEVRRWYDGYLLNGYHVYNPKAVVSVMLRGTFQSYWSRTGTYESVLPLIGMNYDGLKTSIIEMLSGTAVPVDVSMFQNDMVSLDGADDVLTLLIHLGYLAYDALYRKAFIPNEEIREEMLIATRKSKWDEFLTFRIQSDELLSATLDQDAEAVAAGIEQIHTEYASSIQYNNENSLSSVLTIAYLSSIQYYFKPVREMPTGRGFADFAYIPKPEYAQDYPALIVELKWNQNARTALAQIRERNYPQSLLQYTGDVLLVGINYDKKSKQHECVIEQYQK